MAVSSEVSSSRLSAESIPKAALLMVGASLFFVIMNSLAKSLSGLIPSQEIALFRSMTNFIFLLPIIIHKKRSFTGNNKKVMFTRSVLGYASLYLAFYSMNAGILAESTILMKTSIIFSALFSAIFLGERINIKILSASLIGFVGAAVIINPSPTNLVSLAGLAALTSGLIIGLIAVTLRKLQQTDDSLSIVFAFSMWGTILGIIASAPVFVVPTLHQSSVMLATGISGLIAQFMFTESFKYGPASDIHPFMYTEILFAILIGSYLFQEPIQTSTVIGAALIAISGMTILKIKKFKK